MAVSFNSSDFKPSAVNICPKNFTSVTQNVAFFLLSLRFFSRHCFISSLSSRRDFRELLVWFHYAPKWEYRRVSFQHLSNLLKFLFVSVGILLMLALFQMETRMLLINCCRCLIRFDDSRLLHLKLKKHSLLRE